MKKYVKKYVADNGDIYTVETRSCGGCIVSFITDIRFNSVLHC